MLLALVGRIVFIELRILKTLSRVANVTQCIRQGREYTNLSARAVGVRFARYLAGACVVRPSVAGIQWCHTTPATEETAFGLLGGRRTPKHHQGRDGHRHQSQAVFDLHDQ